MRVRPLLAATLVLLTGLVAGTPSAAATRDGPRLTNSRPCPAVTDFTCSDLIVPLDRSRRVRGDLTLNVAVAGNTTAPRGTLLFLTGGPGQPGVSFVPTIRQRLAPLLDDYRLVMIDQRGTGPNGIDCPKLQAEVGSSDITAPSPGAVQECADLLGSTRNFYTTADTVADLEDLRTALRAPRWTLDGVSYGSFVAIHYGLTYPHRVDRLVLDSVVPQRGVPALYRESLARSAYVLRTACAEQNCGFDPAADLATVVNRYSNGVGVFNLLVIASIVDPKLTAANFFPVLQFLHLAAHGETGPLDQAVEALLRDGSPYEAFSSGLHAATFCADVDELPWGSPRAPLAGRERATAHVIAKLPARSTWPFPTEVAGEQGIIQTCESWPSSRPNPTPPLRRLTMPVLLLAGDRDLSTPLAWAQEQARQTPQGELVVVPGMGHSIQGRNPIGDAAVQDFLLR
ncbi:alpha/beta hydrolase [Asanoa sp. WMMD1127]|uniref:alpha/beta hydrolase n=1 Tax=Asanoa sp. WMMD1127 TaxID=3016107 RepID=UPI0024178734|nr:alpha/beta hydrolase [Asanoa sp. WMMD1127]MDG4821385.1 alpha/beta hydrolase [Asanoa sp. WMMD1127]